MFTIKETITKTNAIANQSKKIVNLIDEVMPSILYHAMKDGQAVPAADLVGKISHKHRPAVVEYLTTLGPFTYSKDKGFAYSKLKAREYPAEQGTDDRDTWAIITIGDMPLFSEFAGKADEVIETKPFDFDAALITLLHRAKLAQAGQSTKYEGLADTKYLQMIRNNLPGDVLTKIDTIKDNGKSQDIIPPVEADDVQVAA